MEDTQSTNRNQQLLLWGLVVLFAALMSVPFLVPHCGFVSLVGFVPLLCLDRVATLAGLKRVWIYHYSAFLLWNFITTFWVCNATIGGGIFASTYNALQMSIIFGAFRLSKKYFKGVLPYIFLVAFWIAWERFYFNVDMSWPWLVLGNAFARSIGSIQWYEYTGTLGGSLWVFLVNITIFLIMVGLSDGSLSLCGKKAKWAVLVWTVLIIIGPFVASGIIYSRYEEKEDTLEVFIFQPNIDPYHKFEALSQSQQNEILLSQMEKALARRSSVVQSTGAQSSVVQSPDNAKPLLLLAPETFTSDVVTGRYGNSATIRSFVDFLRDRPGVNILFGASTRTFITSPERPSDLARSRGVNMWSESHNSALIVDGTGRTEIFHKSKLVVGAERMPCPKYFRKLDELLGGVMGRCEGQDSISILHCVAPTQTVNVGCAVCYESVYGEYCTGYPLAGAEVMTVITNDAWWGDTPGYRQHLSYSSLRAIETRRSIARCANTGISAFIDQRGRIHNPSPWWQTAVLHGYVNRNADLTFFVRHGDLTGRICTFLFWLLVLALIVSIILKATNPNE